MTGQGQVADWREQHGGNHHEEDDDDTETKLAVVLEGYFCFKIKINKKNDLYV